MPLQRAKGSVQSLMAGTSDRLLTEMQTRSTHVDTGAPNQGAELPLKSAEASLCFDGPQTPGRARRLAGRRGDELVPSISSYGTARGTRAQPNNKESSAFASGPVVLECP